MNKSVLFSVIPELKANDWKGAIKELVDSVSLENKESILTAIMNREKEGSTAIGNSIAVPHARIDGITELHAVLGRSGKGIEMGGNIVNIFLLILIPRDAAASHLDFLSASVRVLSIPANRERIMESSDETEMLEVLC